MANPLIWQQMAAAVDDEDGPPRYERIAAVVERGILTGLLRAGERLPTVRELSRRLGVSATTIVAAYNMLRQKELIRGEVGRGTFVGAAGSRLAPGPRFAPGAPVPTDGVPDNPGAWRRRALVTTELRLRSSHPHAIDLTRGTPDPALLPLAEIREGLRRAAGELAAEDLQYPAHIEATEELTSAVMPIFAADDVHATSDELLVGSSAQQFLTLMIRVLRRRASGADLPVAVEDPGYQTAMDTFERTGCRLIPAGIDKLGMRPDALASALEQGARAVLFTPRAHSPTGASWTPERRIELAEVLASHAGVIAIEDDPLAGIVHAACGSLRNDPRLADRVVHVRSFSKSLGPDLRIAVALCDPATRGALAEEKSFDDGWSSRLMQKTLAYTLQAAQGRLAEARDAYAERRAVAARVVHERLAPVGGAADPGADGLHVWVRLPPGLDGQQVLNHTAARGFLAAPGEPFFVRPGDHSAIRLNAGAATSAGIAEAAGYALADAIDELLTSQIASPSWAITV